MSSTDFITHFITHGGVQRIYPLHRDERTVTTVELSVVCHSCSYGGDRGLWEAALLINGEVRPFSDRPDPVGWLTDADVSDLVRHLRSELRRGVAWSNLTAAAWA